MADLITPSDYARHRNVSPQAIDKLIKAGKVPTHNGMIDPDEADMSIEASTDPIKRQMSNGAMNTMDGNNYIAARTAVEILKAKRSRLELEKAEGKLIDKHKTQAAVFAFARAERDAWLNWPSRIAAELGAEIGVETEKLRPILEIYVRRHLAGLAEPRLRFPRS